MSKFEAYIDQVLTEDEKDSRPVCPYPLNNGECYVARRDPEEGCLNCNWAKKSFESLKK